MTAKLPPELIRELEKSGDRPLSVENPATKRVYVLVDTECFDVIPRHPKSPSANGSWTEAKNDRRCELIRKKFSTGIDQTDGEELSRLQEEISAYRARTVPLPYDVVEE